MKKFALLFFSWFLLFGLSTKTLASSLPTGTLLTIGPGSFFTLVAGTYTASMTSISPNSTDKGILLSTDQPAGTGTHLGVPDYLTDFGPIDKPWEIIGQTGHHFQDLAAGGVSGVYPEGGTADMYGWRMAWAGFIVDLGNGPNGPGVATVSVSGSSYTLDYAACIPAYDPSGLGGICVSENLALSSALPLSPFETAASPSDYTLHLEGTIVSAVPEPASLALIGTGLACLIGIKRKWRK